MYHITVSQEEMNVIIKGLSVLPLGEAMNTFQRVIQQVQKQQAGQQAMAGQALPNGEDTSIPN